MPAVSVIMPAYNAERYLHAAVDSVLRQSFADLELLIVDDGSSDGTVAVALKDVGRPRPLVGNGLLRIVQGRLAFRRRTHEKAGVEAARRSFGRNPAADVVHRVDGQSQSLRAADVS